MRTGPTFLASFLLLGAAGTAAAQQPNQTTDPANVGNQGQAPTGDAVPVPAAASPTAPPAAVAPPPAAPVAASPLPAVQASPPVLPAPSAAAAEATPKVNPEAPLETGPVAVKGKWSPVLYGFVEFDSMHDSTESFNDFMGNGVIANPANNAYNGNHGRTQFGMRNSRLGFKLSAPESNGIKTTGIIEMDFLGNQPSNPAQVGNTAPAAVSEGGYFSSPTFRVRHFALKLENPYVDVLLGQYWQLFGWQTYFHPNTVEIQGVPGQIFSRAAQARFSHVFKTEPVNVEVAVAASRPPQRDSETPDGQAGLRVMLNDWKGVHTMGGTGTAADAAAIGFSGVTRRFVLPAYQAPHTDKVSTTGWGVSTDVLLPIIPGSMDDRANALTLTGSWVVGRGIADLFTGLSDGNTASWALPNPTGATPAPAYAPGNINIDSGLVEFGSTGRPHAIMWQAYLAGIQYYLPPSGKLWVSANYSHMKSNDILLFVDPAARAAIYNKAEWYDANVFLDVTIAARLGLEYAHTKQTFGNDTTRTNSRVQFSGWLIF